MNAFIRGYALGNMMASPPAAVAALWMGKPLFALLFATVFVLAALVWRQRGGEA